MIWFDKKTLTPSVSLSVHDQVRREGEGKVFPGPATFAGGGRHRSKIVKGGFFLTSNMHKIKFRPGLHPETRIGVYDAPQTPSRMVRGYPSTRFLPLDAPAHTE